MSGKWKYLGNRPYEEQEDIYRTPAQKIEDAKVMRELDQKFRDDLAKKKALVASWNEMGQYARIDGFVFPIEIAEINEQFLGKHFQTKVHFGLKKIVLFRLISANADDLWLMQDEFVKETGEYPFMNVTSQKWW